MRMRLRYPSDCRCLSIPSIGIKLAGLFAWLALWKSKSPQPSGDGTVAHAHQTRDQLLRHALLGEARSPAHSEPDDPHDGRSGYGFAAGRAFSLALARTQPPSACRLLAFSSSAGP